MQEYQYKMGKMKCIHMRIATQGKLTPLWVSIKKQNEDEDMVVYVSKK